MPSEKDIVEETRELLADLPAVADAAYNIEYALFADAVERERRSPFWGHSKQLARVYARAPELLRALADEVGRLRGEIALHRGLKAMDTEGSRLFAEGELEELNEIRDCDKCDLCEDHH